MGGLRGTGRVGRMNYEKGRWVDRVGIQWIEANRRVEPSCFFVMQYIYTVSDFRGS